MDIAPDALTTLRQVGICGASYLARAVGVQGRFAYMVDAPTGASLAGYNLLRHAGALVALQAWNDDLPSVASDSISRASGYLRHKVIRVTPDAWAVASKGRMKLGGSALFLLALLPAVSHADPEAEEICRGLACYLVSQQTPSGNFISIRPVDGGAPSRFKSGYYSGQAILALSRAYEGLGNPEYLAAAVAGADRITAAEPLPLPNVDTADHWTVMALEAVCGHVPDRRFRDQVMARGARIQQQVLQARAGGSLLVVNPDYGCAQAATRGEALVSVARLAHSVGDISTAAAAIKAVSTIAAYCASHQWTAPGPEVSRGGFVRAQDDLRIRIDVVQHAILAIRGLIDMTDRPAPGAGLTPQSRNINRPRLTNA
jgi:hypothetical protein